MKTNRLYDGFYQLISVEHLPDHPMYEKSLSISFFGYQGKDPLSLLLPLLLLLSPIRLAVVRVLGENTTVLIRSMDHLVAGAWVVVAPDRYSNWIMLQRWSLAKT